MDVIETMSYSQYKKHYADCRTISGSYDAFNKTIKIIIPDGRMKKNGVRNKSYSNYEFKAMYNNTVFSLSYKAVSEETAKKQHEKYCKQKGYTIAADKAIINGSEPEQKRYTYLFKVDNVTYYKIFKGYTKKEAEEAAIKFCQKNSFIFLQESTVYCPALVYPEYVK